MVAGKIFQLNHTYTPLIKVNLPSRGLYLLRIKLLHTTLLNFTVNTSISSTSNFENSIHMKLVILEGLNLELFIINLTKLNLLIHLLCIIIKRFNFAKLNFCGLTKSNFCGKISQLKLSLPYPLVGLLSFAVLIFAVLHLSAKTVRVYLLKIKALYIYDML